MAETGNSIDAELRAVVFDPAVEAKKVEQDGTKGLVESSAVNFYAPDVTTDEAKAYFESIVDKGNRSPVEYWSEQPFGKRRRRSGV